MGLFGWTNPKSVKSDGGKPFLERRNGLGVTKEEMRAKFMEMTDNTRGYTQHIMTRQEKWSMAQELFSDPRIGSYINTKEVDKKIDQLKHMEDYMKYHPEARDRFQQSRVQDQIDFFNFRTV